MYKTFKIQDFNKMNAHPVSLNPFAAGFCPSKPQPTANVTQYIEWLAGEDSHWYLVKNVLNQQADEVVLKLYHLLNSVFTEEIVGEYRAGIINAYLGAPQAEWNDIKKKVGFIMPQIGDYGHDLLAATVTLSSVRTPEFRALLVNTANRFFTFETTTTERVYILKAFAKKSDEELKKLAEADQPSRILFAHESIPPEVLRSYK